MNNIQKILAALFLSLSTMISAAASYSCYTISLFKSYNENPDRGLKSDNGGRRTPPIPIPCTVSEAEGITVAISEADIIAYEIWDAEGAACVASYVEGTDAATHLLSTPGEYQLRIVTSEYSYIGYITTL